MYDEDQIFNGVRVVSLNNGMAIAEWVTIFFKLNIAKKRV